MVPGVAILFREKNLPGQGHPPATNCFGCNWRFYKRFRAPRRENSGDSRIYGMRGS
jgi:hypothetical protein